MSYALGTPLNVYLRFWRGVSRARLFTQRTRSSKVWPVTLNLHLVPLDGFTVPVCPPQFGPQRLSLTNYLACRTQYYPPPGYTPQQSSFPPPRPHGLTSHPAGGSSPTSWRQKQTPRGFSRGLAVCLVVVLFLTVLMISQTDPLAPLIDVDSATRHASMENSTLIIEREKTEREREAMAREKELWEKARENRIPLGAFWDAVWPAWDCRAYGRREYWGVLKNIPKDWTPMDACMNMPVEIKGVTVRRPQRCAYVWGSPHIQGYWMVDWDQPDCKPWYHDYQDAVGANRPSPAPGFCLHIFRNRDARATGPANVKSKLRSWV